MVKSMKRLLSCLVVVGIWSLTTWGAVPQMINFQGILRTSEGKLVSGAVNLTFSIYDAASGGTPLWSEGQSVTVEAGIYEARLGAVTPLPLSLFDGNTRYLGVKVGDDPEMTPRLPLISVPYAFRAAAADTATNATNADAVDGFSASGTATPGQLLALDENKQLKGMSVSAEASGNNYALFLNGKIGAAICVGSGTVPAGVDGVPVANTAVTLNSIILLSVGPGDDANQEAIKVSSITPGSGFTVKAVDGNMGVGTPFRYIIIN